MIDRLKEARRVFDTEIDTLIKVRDSLGADFSNICNYILNCTGKVVWIGMGKPGHIARKLAATMASLGTPSFALHPAEALHGDIGMLSENDIVIILSYSGESSEIIKILPIIKLIGTKIVAVTGNADSTLAQNSDIVQVFPQFREACHMGLAPTSSTTAELVLGDALAVVVSQEKDFRKADFGKYHPAGSLGKQILYKIRDVMLMADDTPVVSDSAYLNEAIVEMAHYGLSIVTVVDKKKIKGIFTDGDMRRLLQHEADIYRIKIADIMTRKPYVAREEMLAIDALNLMRNKRFTAMPVVDDDDNYLGIVTIHSIIKSGVVPAIEE